MNHAAKLAARSLALTLAAAPISYAQQDKQPYAAAAFAPADVVGVKLGMTPEEVRAVLKARGLPTHEVTATLSYPDTRSDRGVGSTLSVPNGRFLSEIDQGAPSPASDNLVVYFSPKPGQERVVAVLHGVNYRRGEETRMVDLRKAFVEKYGEPPRGAEPDKPQPVSFSYIWNIEGRKDVVGDRCNFNLPTPGGNYVTSNATLIPTLVRKGCGPTSVRVSWDELDPHVPTDQRLVRAYSVGIVALPLAYDGLVAAVNLTKEAQAAGSQDAAKRASANKPTL